MAETKIMKYQNYIFDLYGTLVDIHTDEDDEKLWEALALFYGKQNANYTAKEIHADYLANVEALLATTYEGATIDEAKQEIFLKFRENIQVRRFARTEGKVVTYVHAGGKIGVMVTFDTDVAESDAFVAMGKNVAMQIAAMNPSYLDQASVPAEVIAKEKDILVSQMKEDPKMANKPDAVLGKIVEGKIGKYYKENCLVEQQYVIDGDLTGGKYGENTAKELGGSVKIASFVRFEKGEGIEKREDNFAEEIANMVK